MRTRAFWLAAYWTPLALAAHGDSESPAFEEGNFTKHAQDDTTCASYGEKHWAGTVDISDEKSLFYWFFDSRNDPENDPIIIWLNGGPGASSMNGLFQEMGPCVIPANSSTSEPNPHSWNNNASLLFIDQPAGVGFSQLKPGTPNVAGDVPGAKDLQKFLRLWFKDVFPAKADLPIHFVGESYGGHYVPATMKVILDSRDEDSPDAFWGNITSIILVSGLVDQLASAEGEWTLLCTDFRGHHDYHWNKTVCDKLAGLFVKGEYLELACQLNYDGETCKAVSDYMVYPLDVLYDDVDKGIVSPHNIEKACEIRPMCLPPDQGNLTAFLNKPEVLASLGFSTDFEWQLANGEASQAYRDALSDVKPTTREIEHILDAHKTCPKAQKDPIRVLFLNGNLDATCPTPGQAWVNDRLRWSGAAEYRASEYRPWGQLGLGVGNGIWKASKDKQLVFVGVDDAGHMVPMDQPDVTDALILKWLSGQ